MSVRRPFTVEDSSVRIFRAPEERSTSVPAAEVSEIAAAAGATRGMFLRRGARVVLVVVVGNVVVLDATVVRDGGSVNGATGTTLRLATGAAGWASNRPIPSGDTRSKEID